MRAPLMDAGSGVQGLAAEKRQAPVEDCAQPGWAPPSSG